MTAYRCLRCRDSRIIAVGSGPGPGDPLDIAPCPECVTGEQEPEGIMDYEDCPPGMDVDELYDDDDWYRRVEERMREGYARIDAEEQVREDVDYEAHRPEAVRY